MRLHGKRSSELLDQASVNLGETAARRSFFLLDQDQEMTFGGLPIFGTSRQLALHSDMSGVLHMLGSKDAYPADAYPAIDLGCDLAHTFSSSRRELALSPTCQPRGKVVSTKVGCGRYGNQAGRASLRRIRGGSANDYPHTLGSSH